VKKGERTKATILEAARELFGAVGYERTTIRDVADRAEIDPSMVIRYFVSKERLFAEAADFDLRLPDLSSVDRDNAGAVLVRHFISIWEGERAVPGMVVLLRSASSSEEAAQRMRSVFGKQVMPAIAHLAGGADAKQRAGLIAAQLLGLAFARYIMELPPLSTAKPDALISWVAPSVQRYLTGDLG
jgi:AcrR family transcriptional regulator